MANSRIYVGNLPFTATSDDVRSLFSAGGRTVTDVHLVTDRETGRARGFAFVEMSTPQEAQDAINALSSATMGGRALVINEAKEREKRGGFGGGNRSPGGGGPGGGGSGGDRRSGGRRNDRDY